MVKPSKEVCTNEVSASHMAGKTLNTMMLWFSFKIGSIIIVSVESIWVLSRCGSPLFCTTGLCEQSRTARKYSSIHLTYNDYFSARKLVNPATSSHATREQVLLLWCNTSHDGFATAATGFKSIKLYLAAHGTKLISVLINASFS